MHDTPRVIYTVLQVVTLLDTNKQQTMTGVQPWLQQAPKTKITLSRCTATDRRWMIEVGS